MRVLIVGCGYIGLPLGVALARQGHTVFGLRRRSAAAPQVVAAGLRPLVADITQPAELRALPGPFDWVVNTVASPSGGGAEEYRRTYLEGTANLIRWLAEDTPPQCYVYTGSTGVYGQDDGGWVDETSATAPAAPTAQILVETEQALLRACRDSTFPAVTLRLAGIYGPGRTYWLRQFLSGEARIPGDGRRWMNMVHRDDIVQSIQAALIRGRPGEVYNVCDDQPVTYLQFFRWLADQTRRPAPDFAPEEVQTRRKRGLTNKRVSNRKLKEALAVELRFPSYREGYALEIASAGLVGPS